MPAADLLIRCSSLGRLMTDPRSKGEGILSVGAKTLIRELAAQEIFGVDFEVSSKQMEKGIRCEPDSIALLNRVRALSLTKNAERRDNGLITGECDLFDAERRRGHDLKTSWSIATFPIALADCEDKAYEWQMRGYLLLWDADEWEVNYALVNTPDDLIGYEPQALHFVDHIPEHHRLTSWTVKRDAEKEAAILERVKAAREYYAEVIAEFDRSHPAGDLIAAARALLAEGQRSEPEPQPAATVIQMPAVSPSPASNEPQIAAAVVPIRQEAPAGPPTLTLGAIKDRIAPLSIDAAGLARLGFPHAATDKSAKLYFESSFGPMVDSLVAHLRSAQEQHRKAA